VGPDLAGTIVELVNAHPQTYDKYTIARILTGQDKETEFSGKLPLLTDDEIISTINVLVDEHTLAANEDKLEVTQLDSVLLEKLRRWRSDTADAESQPLYKVAHNKSLETIARLQVKTHKQLLAIDGIGPATMRKYGGKIIAIVEEHVARKKEKRLLYDADTDILLAAFDRSEHDDDYLKNLNDEQCLAVCSEEKRLACIAGAGSGKTTVLTHRIVHLVKRHEVASRNILAITFTKKAAHNMRKRLQEHLQDHDVSVMTFNSFCEHILRQIDGNKQVINEQQQFMFLVRACTSAGYDQEELIDLYMRVAGGFDHEQSLKDLLWLIGDLYEFVKHEALPADYLEECLSDTSGDERALLEAIIKVIDAYEHGKKEFALRDYTDQLSQTVAALLVNTSLVSALQRKYTHILVDEFQDVNPIQQELLSLLVTDTTSLFVVGDPRQSIFGFRGSKPEILLNVKSYFVGTKIIDLAANYRSAPKIIDFANAIVEPLGYGKPQVPQIKHDAIIKIIENTTAEEEALFVAQNIKLLRLRQNIAHNQIFVLARTNAQLELLSKVFDQCDLDYVLKEHGDDVLPHQVVLSTVHAIKGLEAKVVFVCGLVHGKFPLQGSQLSMVEQIKSHAAYNSFEEEIRLYYVALTRAKEALYLSYYMRDEKGGKTKSSFLKHAYGFTCS